LAGKEKCLWITSFPAQLERTEIFIPEAFWNLWLGLNPETEQVQIVEADPAIAHSFHQMDANRTRES
jgi:hypothetical protein